MRFEVCNPGRGIEADLLKDPFQAGKRTYQRREKDDDGLGLGLYIVREIAKAHGGEVETRAAHGETIVAVRLPR